MHELIMSIEVVLIFLSIQFFKEVQLAFQLVLLNPLFLKVAIVNCRCSSFAKTPKAPTSVISSCDAVNFDIFYFRYYQSSYSPNFGVLCLKDLLLLNMCRFGIIVKLESKMGNCRGFVQRTSMKPNEIGKATWKL